MLGNETVGGTLREGVPPYNFGQPGTPSIITLAREHNIVAPVTLHNPYFDVNGTRYSKEGTSIPLKIAVFKIRS